MKRICVRCGALVQSSFVNGYQYYCPVHDEDLYGIETMEVQEDPYKMSPELEKRIDERLVFGESYGNPLHFFQNMYWDGVFVGRYFYRDTNNFLKAPETKFAIQVPEDAVKSEDHEKYGLHHNGEPGEMYSCLERVFENLGEAIEFVERILQDFPECYGTPEDWDRI